MKRAKDGFFLFAIAVISLVAEISANRSSSSSCSFVIEYTSAVSPISSASTNASTFFSYAKDKII
jgi:hypothetical protein